MLSEKLHFLEIGPAHQKLWSFKCMLKILNSILSTLKTLNRVCGWFDYVFLGWCEEKRSEGDQSIIGDTLIVQAQNTLVD